MGNKSRISNLERTNCRGNFPPHHKGLVLIEMIVAMAVVGILALVIYPNIMNSLRTRKLENTARDVLTTLQRGKFQAVKTKLNHRVRFISEASGWVFLIETENSPNQWNIMPGTVRKAIPFEFNVNVSLPNQTVVFSPLGFILNYSSAQNSITIQSSKLATLGQPDQRIINVFAGGSVKYTKSQSS